MYAWVRGKALACLPPGTNRVIATGVGLFSIGLTVGPASSILADDRVIARELRETPVAAYAGSVVWSSYDPETKKYWLMASLSGEAPERVAIDPRGSPFDVDLGPGQGGRPTAVYSRCRVDPIAGERGPAYATGRRCDLYMFEFSTSRERRISAASTPGASEYLPAIWRGRLVFARRTDRQRSVRLYEHDLETHRERLVGHGPANQVTPPFGHRDGPNSVDVRGTRIAFVWGSYPRNCPRQAEGPAEQEEPFATRLFSVRARTRPKTVRVGCSTEFPTLRDIVAVGLIHGGLFYGSEVIRRRSTERPREQEVTEIIAGKSRKLARLHGPETMLSLSGDRTGLAIAVFESSSGAGPVPTRPVVVKSLEYRQGS